MFREVTQRLGAESILSNLILRQGRYLNKNTDNKDWWDYREP